MGTSTSHGGPKDRPPLLPDWRCPRRCRPFHRSLRSFRTRRPFRSRVSPPSSRSRRFIRRHLHLTHSPRPLTGHSSENRDGALQAVDWGASPHPVAAAVWDGRRSAMSGRGRITLCFDQFHRWQTRRVPLCRIPVRRRSGRARRRVREARTRLDCGARPRQRCRSHRGCGMSRRADREEIAAREATSECLRKSSPT